MIVTLTANPSLDRTYRVDVLARGDVQRTKDRRLDAGGKGINVALALQAHGHQVCAVLPVGGHEGDQLLDILAAHDLDVRALCVGESTRTNVSVSERDGTLTKVNEPGPALDAGELRALIEETERASAQARWLVLSGSLPPGVPDELYANIVTTSQAAGVRVAVDTSGPALAKAIAAGPDLIKPNVEELAEAAGMHLDTVDDARLATRLLIDRGAKAVLATLGPAGVLLAYADTVHHATTPAVTPISTVGAGDAALAGYLSVSDNPLLAVAAAAGWGVAAVRLPGTTMPAPHDINLAEVTVTTAHDGSDPLPSGSARL